MSSSSKAPLVPPVYPHPPPFNISSLSSSRTFKPSRLAPQPPPPPPLQAPPPTTHQAPSSDIPSSPTTSSFYAPSSTASASRTARPAPPPTRSYKSQSSSRRSATTSSSPTSSTSAGTTLRSHAHTNSRLAKRPPPTHRDLSLGEGVNPFAVGVEGGGWAPGGMRNGEWEEWTEDENVGLELEVLKARREWMQRWRVEEERRREEFDGLGDLEEEGEEEEEEDLEGPEPPPDLLYDENDLLASALALPRLPSLASDPGNSSQAEDTDMELDDDAEVDPASIHAFEVALAETACPSCRAVKGCIEAKDGGARCGSCGWGIALEVLKPLGEAFGSHHRGDYERHRPIFSYTPFTGTIVFCDGCEEEFAA